MQIGIKLAPYSANNIHANILMVQFSSWIISFPLSYLLHEHGTILNCLQGKSPLPDLLPGSCYSLPFAFFDLLFQGARLQTGRNSQSWDCWVVCVCFVFTISFFHLDSSVTFCSLLIVDCFVWIFQFWRTIEVCGTYLKMPHQRWKRGVCQLVFDQS